MRGLVPSPLLLLHCIVTIIYDSTMLVDSNYIKDSVSVVLRMGLLYRY